MLIVLIPQRSNIDVLYKIMENIIGHAVFQTKYKKQKIIEVVYVLFEFVCVCV